PPSVAGCSRFCVVWSPPAPSPESRVGAVSDGFDGTPVGSGGLALGDSPPSEVDSEGSGLPVSSDDEPPPEEDPVEEPVPEEVSLSDGSSLVPVPVSLAG